MLKNRIKTLIDLIENTEVQEIEVSSFWGAQKIKLNKGDTAKSEVIIQKELNTHSELKEKISDSTSDKDISLKPDSISDNKEDKPDELTIPQNFHELKAPLVGTYYSSPKPDDPPFMNIGDKISKGQTIGIIEAMKIFNEIESDIDGTVLEICVENGSPVEFDQLILKIKPE